MAQTKLEFIFSADASTGIAEIKKVTTELDAMGKKASESNKTGETASGAFGKSIESLGRTIGDFAKNPLGSMQSGIAGIVDRLGPMAIGLASIGSAVAGAAISLFKMGASAADAAERYQNLSAQTGLSSQKLQALNQIAREAGLESLDLGRAIGQLNQQLGSGKVGDFEKAMKAFNIQLVDTATGKPKDALQLLTDLQGVLAAIPDPTERAQTAQAALGGRLRELIPLLVNAEKPLTDLVDEMERTGPVVDKVTEKNLLKFDAALDKAGRAWETLKTGIASGIGSILGALTEYEVQWTRIGTMMIPTGIKKVAVAHTEEKLSIEEKLKKYDDMVLKQNAAKAGLEKLKTATDEQQKAVSKLKDEIQAKLKPMDDVVDKYKAWTAQGISTNDFVKVHAQEIMAAASKQTELGQKLDSTAIMLLEQALEFDHAKNSARDYGGSITEIARTAIPGFQTAMENGKKALEGLSATVGEYNLGGLQATYNTQQKLNELLGKPSTEPVTVLGATFKSAGESIKNDFGNAISTVKTNFAQAIADILFEGGSFGQKIGDIFKQAGKSMLASLIENMLTPLTNIMSEFAGKIGNWIAGIFGGGGSSVIGTGSGGVSSILSGLSTSLTGWVGGAISAVGSIIGGLLANMGNKDKDIEANTRYTAIDVHTMVDILHDVNKVLWEGVTRISKLDEVVSWNTLVAAAVLGVNDTLWTIADLIGQIRDRIGITGSDGIVTGGAVSISTSSVGRQAITGITTAGRQTVTSNQQLTVNVNVSGAAGSTTEWRSIVRDVVVPELVSAIETNSGGAKYNLKGALA